MRNLESLFQVSLTIKILLILMGVILTTFSSFLAGYSWLTPILGACPIYPFYLKQVYDRQYSSALKWVLFWAVLQTFIIIIATLISPEMAEKAIANGENYTSVMLHWIKTGEGAEGSLNLFLPIHLKHYGLFCLLCLITFGSTALILGTYLLNYMNFYVAKLIKLSDNPLFTAVVAWPPWSLLRVMGYIITGIALTALSLKLLAKFKSYSERSFPLNYFLVGIGFIIGDIIIKAILASFWQQLIKASLYS